MKRSQPELLQTNGRRDKELKKSDREDEPSTSQGGKIALRRATQWRQNVAILKAAEM